MSGGSPTRGSSVTSIALNTLAFLTVCTATAALVALLLRLLGTQHWVTAATIAWCVAVLSLATLEVRAAGFPRSPGAYHPDVLDRMRRPLWVLSVSWAAIGSPLVVFLYWGVTPGIVTLVLTPPGILLGIGLITVPVMPFWSRRLRRSFRNRHAGRDILVWTMPAALTPRHLQSSSDQSFAEQYDKWGRFLVTVIQPALPSGVLLHPSDQLRDPIEVLSSIFAKKERRAHLDEQPFLIHIARDDCPKVSLGTSLDDAFAAWLAGEQVDDRVRSALMHAAAALRAQAAGRGEADQAPLTMPPQRVPAPERESSPQRGVGQ